tara:strand:- start:515 stop:1099 length:585 start_codon:yes stop_codon:yes gene_type:complete
MTTILNYDNNDIRGHLEVVKIYSDGSEEIHFSEDNVITSGMGYTLLKAFQVEAGGNISSFQIPYFQLGVSGNTGAQVSSTGELSAALSSAAQYGADVNFEISVHDLSSGSGVSDALFGVIPFAYIKKLSPTRVMYSIFVGESSCNDLTLNEIGLFSRNPNQSATEGSYLCAYRYFTGLLKKDMFSVLFRWTLEF